MSIAFFIIPPLTSVVIMLQLTDSDYIAIGGLVAALIFGAIAVVQTQRAARLNQRIAKAQGVFKTPTVGVRLFDQKDFESFLLAVPIRTGRVFEFPLQYEIENSGDKTAEEIEVILRVSKDLCYGGSPASFSGAPRKVDANISSESENFTTFTFQVSTLHPKQKIAVNHPVSLVHDTLLRHSVTVQTEDESSINIPYVLEYAYAIDFVILQKDQHPITRTFSLRVVDTHKRPLRETLNAYNCVLMDKHQKAMSRKNFFERILHAPPDAERLRIIQVNEEDVVMDSAYPIDRISDTAHLMMVDGGNVEYGFFVPAMNIGWDSE